MTSTQFSTKLRISKRCAYPIKETLCQSIQESDRPPPLFPSPPRGKDQSVRPKTAVAVAARGWCNNMWGMMGMTYSVFESFEDNTA